MTTVRNPVLKIRVERANAPPGTPDAVEIDATESVAGIRGSIEAATGEDAGRATLSLSIENVPRNKRRELGGEGQVEVEAGYEDSDQVSPSIMFVGNLVDTPEHRRGPGVVTNILADSTPNVLAEARHALQVNPNKGNENDDRTVSIGRIIQEIARRSGAVISLPESAFEHGVKKYTAKATALTEIERLVQALSYKSGRPHRLVPVPGTSSGAGGVGDLAPSSSTGAKTNAFRVVDVAKGENAVQALEFEFPEDDVYNAGPTPKRARPSKASIINQSNTAQDVQRQAVSLSYEADVPLDPRIALGTHIRIIDHETGEDGELVVTEVKHRFDDWTTSFSGPFERVDLEALA